MVALRCIAGPKEFHPGEMTLEALKVINDRTVSARAATGEFQSVTACSDRDVAVEPPEEPGVEEPSNPTQQARISKTSGPPNVNGVLDSQGNDQRVDQAIVKVNTAPADRIDRDQTPPPQIATADVVGEDEGDVPVEEEPRFGSRRLTPASNRNARTFISDEMQATVPTRCAREASRRRSA